MNAMLVKDLASHILKQNHEHPFVKYMDRVRERGYNIFIDIYVRKFY